MNLYMKMKMGKNLNYKEKAQIGSLLNFFILSLYEF